MLARQVLCRRVRCWTYPRSYLHDLLFLFIWHTPLPPVLSYCLFHVKLLSKAVFLSIITIQLRLYSFGSEISSQNQTLKIIWNLSFSAKIKIEKISQQIILLVMEEMNDYLSKIRPSASEELRMVVAHSCDYFLLMFGQFMYRSSQRELWLFGHYMMFGTDQPVDNLKISFVIQRKKEEKMFIYDLLYSLY